MIKMMVLVGQLLLFLGAAAAGDFYIVDTSEDRFVYGSEDNGRMTLYNAQGNHAEGRLSLITVDAEKGYELTDDDGDSFTVYLNPSGTIEVYVEDRVYHGALMSMKQK